MKTPLLVTYGDIYLGWKLGSGDGSHPTNPVRARLATEKLVERIEGVRVEEPIAAETEARVRDALAQAATPEHIHAVVHNHVSGEWFGPNPENARVAVAMFGGTVRLVDELLAGQIKVGFNPQGAKHHARRGASSGFCVFDDMGWAALELQKAGLRPLYIDWDIHAGDGVFHDLKGSGIPVLSIHNGSTFPNDPQMMDASKRERHTVHNPEGHSYNWCVTPTDGDDAFRWAIDEAVKVIEGYKPDVILVAAGADGHQGANNLGVSNQYTYAGFEYAATRIGEMAREFCDGRVLIGGAGGYQPLDHTPEIWARVVETIYRRATAGNN